MFKIGDKVTVLPFDELDIESCDIEGDYYVYGIGREYYEKFVGKKYTIYESDDSNSIMPVCMLLEDDNKIYFPFGCLKKL